MKTISTKIVPNPKFVKIKKIVLQEFLEFSLNNVSSSKES